MQRLANAWRSLFDVRPGEYRRAVFLSLYLLFVLFAYYVLKSASESMFLNKFDIDKLPNLYILMAVFGGALAVIYSKAAARTSLHTAVTWTMFISIACLIGMWYPLRNRNATTMIYVFAVWVRMFSVVAVTQGWVVASNLFVPSEAKRVYGLLGMGMVVGAVFGGEFTTQMVRFIGTNNLLFASAPLVLMAYGCYLIAVSGGATHVTRAKAAESGEAEFSFRDVASDIARSRHVQALMAIMAMQFIVDTLIDYQFKYMAKSAYHGDALTAFFGRFYGRYLNITELVLQFFFTTTIVRRLGIGGTLQVMPLSLAAASIFTFASPSVLSASFARLVEASTRYTLARTGNELFYMPLPLALRNRIKAFIDIFMDRAARGVSGLLLILCAKWSIGVRGIALITFCIAVPWVALTVRAHREYMRTVRRRLEARRLDLASARVAVGDAGTTHLLETTARSSNPRQAAYALSLLNETPGYDILPILLGLGGSSDAEVRAELYRIARCKSSPAWVDRAAGELQPGVPNAATRQAVIYLIAVAPDRETRARELLDHPDPSIQQAAVEALSGQAELAASVITNEWIIRASLDSDPRRRAVAAAAVAVRGDQGTEVIHTLLADPNPQVAASACAAAGVLRNRAYIFAVTRLLAGSHVRGAAIDALVQYGPGISGTLADTLDDERLPVAARAAVPRILKRLPHQRSADILLAAYKHPERSIRSEALKALTHLRVTAPGLDFGDALLKGYVLNEAHHYYELAASAAPLKAYRGRPHSPASLLARTLDERLRLSLLRVFQLLAILHPAKEMQPAYAAIECLDRERRSAGIEFLDNTLDQDLKRVIMPILDHPERLPDLGRSLFALEAQDVETTLRTLIHSGEPWLASCALAAAAELNIGSLRGDVALAVCSHDSEVNRVAVAAAAAMAS